MTLEKLETLVTELAARMDSLEETIENLRYEGLGGGTYIEVFDEDDYLAADGWDAP